ncbi:hypothetical protein V2J09_009142 [Rumex salicifolius]
MTSPQETMGIPNQEPELELQAESEKQSESENGEKKTEEVNEDRNKDSEEEQSSPRGVLDMPDSSDQSHGSLSSTSSFDKSSSTASFDKSSSSSASFDKSSSSSSTAVQKALGAESYGILFKGFIDSVRKSSMKKLSTIALLTGSDFSKKSSRRKLARIRSAEDAIDFRLLPETKPSWRNFEYAELASATDNFSPERKIGKGGHAEVYKGSLGDGTIVAVKKLLSKEDQVEEDRIGCFLSELGIIAHVEHQNTAKLIGFSVENGLFLVLQYAPCGSLASHLHGSREVLNWEVRFGVAIGVAQGLAYLHNTCQRRIIHRDIKASNILLFEDFQPMISDFGLAKWLPQKWAQHVVHPIEGTFGYLAPEYFMHGIVNEKTDVFAFGVVLLELLTGRHAVDSSRQSLVMWVKPLLESNNVKELIDPQLGDKYDTVELRRAMVTATMCIHHEPSCRPQMNRVVEVLRGEGRPMDMKQRPIQPRTMLIDACDLEDYTCSNYLKDLNRHRELLME